VLGAERLEVGGPEPLMDRAMSFHNKSVAALTPRRRDPELEAGFHTAMSEAA